MHGDGIAVTNRALAHARNITPAKCHSMKTLTQDQPTANKATFTQYGVIIVDSLFKADLSEPDVYKPRGPRTVGRLAENQRLKTLLAVMTWLQVIRLTTGR